MPEADSVKRRTNPSHWFLGLVRSDYLLILAVLAGAALRLYLLPKQIIADDEWHALRAALSTGYGGILGHFGDADHCIPLALLYKLMLDHWFLSELVMRAPALLCGSAALIAFPMLVRRELGRPASHAMAWLLAVSPLHVYVSRYARPYAPALFLAFVGAMAFWRWRRREGRGWSWTYVGCAILAPYFHLTTLPFVAAPLAFALAERLIRRRVPGLRSVSELTLVGAGVAGGWLLLLGYPLLADSGSLVSKVGQRGIALSTLEGALRLLVGTDNSWMVWGAVLSTVGGAIALWRRVPSLLAYWGSLAGAQVLACLAARPMFVEVPIVFTRYCLVVLPILLGCLAAAVAGIEQQARRRARFYPTGVLAVTLASALAYVGPWRGVYYYPNNWTNHGVFQYCYTQNPSVNPYASIRTSLRISDFYRRLGRLSPGRLRIVEAPWYYEWQNNPFPFYQAEHRQWMFVGFVGGPPGQRRNGEYPLELDRLDFRGFVHVIDHVGLRRRGVTYVVFHKALGREMWPPGGRPAVDVSRWLEHYRYLYGPPCFEDSDLAVFEITRLRLGREGSKETG